VHRLPSFRAVLLIPVFSCVAFSTSAQIYHDPHRKTTIGFSVDLNTPSDTVLQIVKGVASDSIIRGTSMYAKEIDLEDADFAKSSTVLPAAPGPGQAFYKVKSKVLSPEHFPAASDMGTVTVRYVVEAVNPQRAHLAIDAVFVTEAGHHLYASDGSVETAEYAEIITQISADRVYKHRKAEVEEALQSLHGEQHHFSRQGSSVAEPTIFAAGDSSGWLRNHCMERETCRGRQKRAEAAAATLLSGASLMINDTAPTGVSAIPKHL
jgi:hypothetical protein